MALKGRPTQADPGHDEGHGDSATIQPVQDIGEILREGSRNIFGHKAGLNE